RRSGVVVRDRTVHLSGGYGVSSAFCFFFFQAEDGIRDRNCARGGSAPKGETAYFADTRELLRPFPGHDVGQSQSSAVCRVEESGRQFGTHAGGTRFIAESSPGAESAQAGGRRRRGPSGFGLLHRAPHR